MHKYDTASVQRATRTKTVSWSAIDALWVTQVLAATGELEFTLQKQTKKTQNGGKTAGYDVNHSTMGHLTMQSGMPSDRLLLVVVSKTLKSCLIS